MIAAVTAKARLATRAPTITMVHAGSMFGTWSSSGGIDCRKNATPKPAAERATAESTAARLSGLRTGRPRGGETGAGVRRGTSVGPVSDRAALMTVAAVGV